MIGRFLGFIGRSLGAAWRWLDAVRRTAFNLVFLFMLGVAAALFWRAAPEVPESAALVLRPAGVLVEQASFSDPFSLLRAGPRDSAAEVVLADLLEAIAHAREDERIRMLVLETDHLLGGGLSKLAELRAALVAFRAAGKPVLVRGERFSQAQYYLASVADEIHLAPDGYVLFNGLARHSAYFGEALERLGIKVHVFRVGEYKSFSEPFTRRNMSEEDRSASVDLLAGLWARIGAEVAQARGLEPEALARYVDDYPALLAEAEGDAARAALQLKLVDRLSTRDSWHALLREKVGAGDEGLGLDGEAAADYRQIGVSAYLAARRAEQVEPPQRVAVLVAQGAIMDGEQPPGAVGGDTLARLIRTAREDDAVKALVLRLDSPGGSAWASELVRRELVLTREAGKPVVASMSSVAASGGYWIAAGADEIWASPYTLTGSIGVFAMFPEFAQPLERLGVHMDGVATGPLAGAFDPRRPLPEAAARSLQLGIEHGYRRFLDTVGEARGMSRAEVDAVARGRVWTGDAAHELGLVDQLGSLDDAVAAAARRAGLTEYQRVWPAASLTPRQRLLQELGVLSGAAEVPPALAAPLGLLLGELERAATALLQWRDRDHLYAHCLCESP